MADPAVLYARIRNRLDLGDSNYLSDNEIGQLCEEAYFDLWDFMVDALGAEAPWERLNIATTANQDSITIAVGSVYRLLRLEFAPVGSTYYRPVRPLNLASEEISVQPTPWPDAQSFRYFARRATRADILTRGSFGGGFAGWKLYFSPVPDAVYTLRLYYIPAPNVQIDSGGNYTGFPDEFPEYVVADVCAKLMDKQEGDSAPFVAERERIKTRIERYAKPHQMNGPKTIADMRSLSRGSSSDDWRRRR